MVPGASQPSLHQGLQLPNDVQIVAAYQVVCVDGPVYYFCVHGGEEHRRQCILSKFRLHNLRMMRIPQRGRLYEGSGYAY
jgi:hypothetical protein